jgi:hypothetical protein
MKANTTGTNNTAVGPRSLQSNTTAANNVAVGDLALGDNTTGTLNTALGNNALESNTTAGGNTAVGYQALYDNTTSSSQTAIGQQALANITGQYNGGNTAVGQGAGFTQTSGYSNTYVGYNSGYSMTSGIKNTILGTYNGNQGNIDIRSLSNNIVLSDGNGNPAYWAEGNGSIYLHHWKATFSGNATGYTAGSAAGTWHQITAVNLNDPAFTAANNWIILTFANASPAYGYTGQIHALVANAGANVSYAGRAIMGCDPSGTFGYQLPISVATHTGTSSLVFEMKVELTGSHKRLYVRSNATQTSNSAVFGVPHLRILTRKIQD